MHTSTWVPPPLHPLPADAQQVEGPGVVMEDALRESQEDVFGHGIAGLDAELDVEEHAGEP